MGIFTRGGPAEATYARVADGEHLWLAVRGAESLALVRPDGPTIEVDAVEETHGDETLLTAVVPLAESLAADDAAAIELTLTHGRKHQPVTPAWEPRAASPTTESTVTTDRRWRLSVHASDGCVVVRRQAVDPTVAVLALTSVDGAVAVRLGGDPTTATLGGAAVPVSDGFVLLDALPDLPVDAATPLLADGLPVVRTRNAMSKPHLSTTLPPLDDAHELRWLRDGRLAVFRRAGADRGGAS